MSRTSAKMNHVFEKATQHWKYVAPLLAQPKNDADYALLVDRLDQLLDIVGDNETHSLMGLVDTLSHLISAYDDKKFQLSGMKGISALKYLMELRQLNQIDLRAIGSQGVVSEILSGKRKLNLRQIMILAKLFKVNIATFVDEIS